MRIFVVVGFSLMLASCYAVTESDPLLSTSRDTTGHSMAIVPAGMRLSNPAVITSRGILAYDRDLRSCKNLAVASIGPDRSVDDTAALLRAIQDKPVKGTVAVKYESDDVATKRDEVVKQCLSKRGYVVEN